MPKQRIEVEARYSDPREFVKDKHQDKRGKKRKLRGLSPTARVETGWTVLFVSCDSDSCGFGEERGEE